MRPRSTQRRYSNLLARNLQSEGSQSSPANVVSSTKKTCARKMLSDYPIAQRCYRLASETTDPRGEAVTKISGPMLQTNSVCTPGENHTKGKLFEIKIKSFVSDGYQNLRARASKRKQSPRISRRLLLLTSSFSTHDPVVILYRRRIGCS